MIIWLASYPKSGNTLVRSLLSSYFFSKDGIFNFELIKNIKQKNNKIEANVTTNMIIEVGINGSKKIELLIIFLTGLVKRERAPDQIYSFQSARA